MQEVSNLKTFGVNEIDAIELTELRKAFSGIKICARKVIPAGSACQWMFRQLSRFCYIQIQNH